MKDNSLVAVFPIFKKLGNNKIDENIRKSNKFIKCPDS